VAWVAVQWWAKVLLILNLAVVVVCQVLLLQDKADRITPTITANARLSVNTVITATEIPVTMSKFSFETLTIIFPYALTMALVGLIESLLTLNTAM
jgi:MFS superfamily sulfate permease-like transporter